MPGRGSYGPGGRWIHDRAHRIMRDSTRRGDPTPKSTAYAVATQQAHSMGKSPKGFRTPTGVRVAKRKYPHPKEYRKTASIMHTSFPGVQGGDSLQRLAFLLGQEQRLEKMAIEMMPQQAQATVQTALTPQPQPTGGQGMTQIRTKSIRQKSNKYATSHTATIGPTQGMGAAAKNTPPPVVTT